MKALIARTLWLVLALAAGPLPAAQTNRVRFGIYMPKYDVYTQTPDVSKRVAEYLRDSDPERIPLAEYKVISDDDIVDYDWPTHTIRLRHSIWFKLREPGVHGVPFVVVADGTPVYVGAFWTGFSSVSTERPVIMWDYQRKANAVTIERAYPGPSFAAQGTDPRQDKRIRKALSERGKLKAEDKGPGPAGQPSTTR